jgi:hypothetical protein
MTAGKPAALLVCLLALTGGGLSGCESGGSGSGSEYTNGSLVSGYVIEPDGTPVAGARVWIRPASYLPDTADAGMPGMDDAVRTDARGRFTLAAVPFGAHTLEVLDTAGRGAASHLVAAEAEAEAGMQVVRPLGSLEGRLIEAEGRPAAGYVQIAGLDRVARADSAGAFLIAGLPAGIHRIRAVSPAQGTGFRQPGQVAILPGRTTRLDSLSAIGFAQEDYSQWSHSRRLHVDPVRVGVTETVTDFPLLIRFRAGDIDFSVSDGKDLRFAGPDGKPLPFEIERWEPGSRLAEAWVRLDTVPADTAGFQITVYWGRPDAADLSQGKGVFADFAGVWHMQEAQWAQTEVSCRDASPAGVPAVGTLQAGIRKAVWGYSGLFQGSQALTVSGHDALRPARGLTLSAWIKAAATDRYGGEIANLGENYALRVDAGGTPRFFVFDDPDWDGTSPSPTDRWKAAIAKDMNLVDKQWHHVAGVFDGAELRLYVDGVLRATAPHAGNLAYARGPDLRIGKNSDADHDFIGQIDEVQVAGKVRPAAWIKLSYENQKPQSELLRFR